VEGGEKMGLSFNQIERIVSDMVKAWNEVEEHRNQIDYVGDDEYVGYREGLYDAYLDVLLTLGYSVDEINEMESQIGKK
jgi:hypothetical protein